MVGSLLECTWTCGLGNGVDQEDGTWSMLLFPGGYRSGILAGLAVASKSASRTASKQRVPDGPASQTSSGREAQVKECSNLPFISVPFFNFYLKLQKSHQSHCKAQSHRPHSECFWPSPSTFTILQHLFPQIAAETSTNQGAAGETPPPPPGLLSLPAAVVKSAHLCAPLPQRHFLGPALTCGPGAQHPSG
nr:uncharacterized protein LOC110564358 isoform X3 [Meriones unguiculatus]